MRKIFMVGAMSLASVSGTAHASTVVQYVTGDSGTGLFNSFDTSLGTLNSVTIDYVVSSNIVGTFTPLPVEGGSAYTISISGSGSSYVSAGSFNWSFFTNPNETSGSTVLEATPFSLNFNDIQALSITDAASLSAFTAGPVAYSYSSFGMPGYSGDGDFTLDSINSFSTTSITYDYTAIAAVPEPATWGLMVLGFGAAGLVLRRKRREVVPAGFVSS